MPRAFSGDDHDLIGAERDVRARVGELDVDLSAAEVVANVYRVASAVRNHMEQRVLAGHGLSWSAFVALFVLWVWGDMESRRLADEVGVTKGTLTGVVKTLERRGWCERREHPGDRRLVVIALTADGERVIRAVYPHFNREEAALTAALPPRERARLAHDLRTILRGVEGSATGVPG